MEAPPLRRKLAAILAADIEGYSRLMHSDEERTLAMLTGHRATVDALIEAADGQIFGTAGDSVLAEFPSVVQAFNCAIAIQLAIDAANQDVDVEHQMRFRIGINVGDVMVKNGDIFGDGVNIAARLESLADAGGICVTRGVRDHMRDRVEATFEDMGEQSVKNIARPVRVFKVVFSDDYEPVLSGSPASVDFVDDTQSASRDHADAEEVAFWEAISEDDDGTEVRLYLERYPNGAFVALANVRLDRESIPQEDPAVEVAFWESVRDSSKASMIEAYLNRYPTGKFAELAKILLAEHDM
ncbi:adenylate/guanylate cyclase domain-containing protein [Rhizobium sp. S152]|uniref:adenylate/guanylate cyclase domain-containing protein n=1 Tax=Rhizobium sp. S152 TaxID=3055038 RepID=UPI0025AA2A3B|nr:adenylate/guanylate cyclase domain-containing protein [Rhizobium sp. S152]MDM9627694.1 adenylate/guanylate cyclase domain-containing protein [Rhizobium sp. S152]